MLAHMSATVAAASHSRFTPTSFASPERLHALDILRGLALFGMILVHLKNLAGREVTGLEGWIPWGVGVFVEQKAWGTFAFLSASASLCCSDGSMRAESGPFPSFCGGSPRSPFSA